MATTQLPSDFKEFLQLLHSKQIEFLLVGGYAVGYYGYPRTTGDIDVWIARTPENANRIVDALREFGFVVPELRPELFLIEDQVIRMGVAPIRIEILTSISGVEFDECYAARTMGILDGIDVPIISLPHLKANKKASGRHKDLNDLQHLSKHL
jgi:hypothetical protein